jgi:hypothetical protein
MRAQSINSLTSTIAQAKQNICSVIGAEGKYLRLISSGKMLAPDTAVLSAFKLPDMRYVITCASTHKHAMYYTSPYIVVPVLVLLVYV